MRRTFIAMLLLLAPCAAQEVPLGDLARQERARQEAVEAANFKLGVAPPLAHAGEKIPAHFLIVHGSVGEGEFYVSLNKHFLFHNHYVPDLPIYVSPMLLDGGNLLEVSLVTTNAPFDVTVEERSLGEANRPVLAQFHANASATPATVTKQVRFTAHPVAQPPVELTDSDRADITKVVKSFYEALKHKDEKEVLALFAPALDDARLLDPEGADFGQKEMTRVAGLVTTDGFEMEPFDVLGLEMEAHGLIVAVKRRDGTPVFSSNELELPNGRRTSFSADTVPLKKIQGQWRLTLPFGF